MDPKLKAMLQRHKFLRELRGGTTQEIAARAVELQHLTEEINFLMTSMRAAAANPPNRKHRRALMKKAVKEQRQAQETLRQARMLVQLAKAESPALPAVQSSVPAPPDEKEPS